MRMREIINLLESLTKARKVILKDGSIAIITLDRTGDCLKVEASVDGKHVGDAVFYQIKTNKLDPNNGSWSSANTIVSADWRRKGVASAMYDLVVRTGYRVIPSGRGYGGKLSPDGEALWRSRMEWKKIRGVSLKTPVHPTHWKPKPIKSTSPPRES